MYTTASFNAYVKWKFTVYKVLMAPDAVAESKAPRFNEGSLTTNSFFYPDDFAIMKLYCISEFLCLFLESISSYEPQVPVLKFSAVLPDSNP